MLPRSQTATYLHCTHSKGVGGLACVQSVCMYGMDMRGVVQRAWNWDVHGLCTLFACKPPQPLVLSGSLPRTHGMPGHGGTVTYAF